ncbi:PHB depolymerase family esterase [Sinirhodobacter populi]|uniref:PHB depolymerase family esterase n=1 Tax=Paenirhodobacter populi TaxID=2306993 RepID=A0A443KNP5_9RHOB|nr:PHB depolymerase family esterase [Sinirhodobacter populi]RWR34528.1 PHB depolymerase family esterase [Sinirhodobacter populi]
MKHDFRAAMRRATDAVRRGDLGDATRVIRAALSGTPQDAAPRTEPQATPRDGMLSRLVVRPPGLGDLRRLADGPVRQMEGMVARQYDGAEGHRDYRIFIPAGTCEGVLMMLHGCKQTPEDFARGTRMNEVATEAGLIVIWPEQPRAANMLCCWNWFEPAHQAAGQGEPAILAAIARQVTSEFGFGPERTFVAGLSAGGAMAAILGESYPDLFGAIGIHSGLPAGAAHDVPSAFAAMGGHGGRGRPAVTENGPRVIVFHGSADTTVHLSNAAALSGEALRVAEEQDGTAGGRPYRTARHATPDGAVRSEVWTVAGAGHAWSGGSPAGSFADAEGPDASREMVRFFLKDSDRD